MYISNQRMYFSIFLSAALITVSVIAIFVSFVELAFTVYGDYDEHPMVAASSYAIFGCSVVFFGIILAFAINKFKYIGWTKRLNRLFENDEDGVILMTEIADTLGMDSSLAEKRFMRIIEKGYLINCSIQRRNGEKAVILTYSSEPVNRKFDVVKCPECGAANTVKVGFIGKCEYCGAPLKKK